MLGLDTKLKYFICIFFFFIFEEVFSCRIPYFQALEISTNSHVNYKGHWNLCCMKSRICVNKYNCKRLHWLTRLPLVSFSWLTDDIVYRHIINLNSILHRIALQNTAHHCIVADMAKAKLASANFKEGSPKRKPTDDERADPWYAVVKLNPLMKLCERPQRNSSRRLLKQNSTNLRLASRFWLPPSFCPL